MNRLFALFLLLNVLVTALVAAEGRSLGDDPVQRKSAPSRHRIAVPGDSSLASFFRYDGTPLPMVSAHRGGAKAGFPENCIETFEHTLESTFALLEIDPRLTKEGEVVLHHDATLERCTTGKGRVIDHTVAELKALQLKDLHGKVTDYHLPTLDETLAWAKGKTILVLDQKDVSSELRARKITEHHAESYAMLIVYRFEEVQKVHAMNPRIMMEVMIPSIEKGEAFEKLGVPWENVIAFVGHEPPTDRRLYDWLHHRGCRCMIGTSRNLDRRWLNGEVQALRHLETSYRDFLAMGADLVETDIPASLGPLLYGASFARPDRPFLYRD